MQHVYGRMNGYGTMGMSLHEELEKLGVVIVDQDKDAEMVPQTVLYNQLPGHALWRHENQKSILFSMFETDVIPAEFAEVIEEYDTVVVPCEENRRAFALHRAKAHVVNLGVDPERWHFTPRKPITWERPFTFLIQGAGWKRKGIDDATKAFLELKALTSIDMRLICKMQLKEPTALDLPVDPDIEYLKASLTMEEEVALYEDVHCVLAPSKGEGWGLCPHQAIAQGIPTILTDAAGHHEFSRFGIPIGWHHESAAYGIWEDTGNWWVPNYDELLEAMRDVVTNYDDHLRRAEINARGISYLTWERTARNLLPFIPEGPLVPSGGIYAFKRKVFPIMVTTHWECDVGGQRYIFDPGEVYYDFADVKRIAYTAGVIHPDCPVEGLTRDMVAEMSARIYSCPTCKRPFETVEEFVQRVLNESQQRA